MTNELLKRTTNVSRSFLYVNSQMVFIYYKPIMNQEIYIYIYIHYQAKIKLMSGGTRSRVSKSSEVKKWQL